MNETQVMPLAQMPDKLDETMPLRVADVQQAVSDGVIHATDVNMDAVEVSRVPRRMDGFSGPFPVRRAIEKFAAEAPIEDVVEVVKALSTEPETAGVEQESSETTLTHALPAVERMTGKPSEFADQHRMARQVQNLKRHLGVHVWYGEHTREFWVMDESGLHPFKSLADMNQGMGW